MKPEESMRGKHPRSEVGLVEALEASVVLGVSGEPQAQWLAEALGLSWSKVASVSLQLSKPLETEMPDGERPRPTKDESRDPRSPGGTLPQAKRLKLLLPASHEPVAFEQYFSEDLERIRAAEKIAPATLEAAQVRPAYQPLLVERWFQGIFTSALSTKAPSREIDFRRLERNVARGETLAELPFKSQASLARGVHVLVDRSETMQPFWRDETYLITRLRRFLGEVLVQPFWFEMDPHRPPASQLRWRGPVPRGFHQDTPVLLVTDFGTGADAATARFMDWEPWLPIFQLAEGSCSPVIALIPSTPSLWPPGLHRFVASALMWDHGTSPQTAARSCKR